MTAVSARYGVPCQMCGASAGEPCRTLTTGRVTDTHATRIFWAGEYRMGRVTMEFMQRWAKKTERKMR